MATINPTFPVPHDPGTDGTWGETEIAAFAVMVGKINDHDNALAALTSTGAISVADNGDGTITITPSQGAYVQPNTLVGASYTLGLLDAQACVENAGANDLLVTVPSNASVPYPVGTVIEFLLYGTGTITLQGATGVALRSPSGLRLTTQYASAAIRKRSTDEWIVAGALVP